MRRSRAQVPNAKLTSEEWKSLSEAFDDEALTWGRNDGSYGNTGLFAAIPSWWRGFLFQVLGNADLSIYLYLLTMCSNKQTCDPTDHDIADATGINSRDTINKSRNRLLRLGFVLCRKVEERSGRRYRQYEYRRPPYEYTIARLLEVEAIDEDLIAKKSKLRSTNPPLYRGVQAAIAHGLKKFFSLDQLREYLEADNSVVKLERLRRLVEIARDRRAEANVPTVTIAFTNITTRQSRRRKPVSRKGNKATAKTRTKKKPKKDSRKSTKRKR